MFNCFGWKGTLDLPGLTQVIRAFQDQTHMATLVGDDDNRVLGLSETNRQKEKTAAWSIWSWRAVKVHLINSAVPLGPRYAVRRGRGTSAHTEARDPDQNLRVTSPPGRAERSTSTSTHLQLWRLLYYYTIKTKHGHILAFNQSTMGSWVLHFP